MDRELNRHDLHDGWPIWAPCAACRNDSAPLLMVWLA